MKYKKIRNAVSHKKITSPETISIVEDVFGITVNNGDSLDITDPKIYGILETESKKLRDICWQHVSQTIQDLV